MNILNPAFTSESLCNENCQLVVPLYQRLFVWEERQIEQLLNDLKNSVEMGAPYYIGIVTVVEKGNKCDVGEKEKKWDIVDGQQRLTFLTLFACECIRRNICTSAWQEFVYLDMKNKKLRIHYFGRPEDEADLIYILDGKPDKVQNKNFRTFLRCFDQMEAVNYSEYVYKNVSFLISELPGSHSTLDLNLFFEKMNAAGRQLVPVDQIKGVYFPATASIFDACLNFEEKFKEPNTQHGEDKKYSLQDIIADTETAIPQEPAIDDGIERYSNRSILRPAIFILHVLKTISGNDKTISLEEAKLLETFKRVWSSDLNTSFVIQMQAYRVWLDENIIFLRRSDDDTLEYAFRSEDENNPENGDKNNNLERKKLKQYQSMLYVSSNDSQKWVLEAFLKTQGEPLTLETIKKLDNQMHPLPKYEGMCYGSINRYWFWKLDYLLWEKCMTAENLLFNGIVPEIKLKEDELKAIKNYHFRQNRSIEHLHPQTSSSPWEENDLHDFGNLAMISASFNSTQSNDSVGVKFARLRDTQIPQGKLESIKMLLMFNVAGGEESGWKEKEAKEHGIKMYSLLEDAITQ